MRGNSVIGGAGSSFGAHYNNILFLAQWCRSRHVSGLAQHLVALAYSSREHDRLPLAMETADDSRHDRATSAHSAHTGCEVTTMQVGRTGSYEAQHHTWPQSPPTLVLRWSST